MIIYIITSVLVMLFIIFFTPIIEISVMNFIANQERKEVDNYGKNKKKRNN